MTNLQESKILHSLSIIKKNADNFEIVRRETKIIERILRAIRPKVRVYKKGVRIEVPQSIIQLEREADKVFSHWIRRRDRHCVTCGATKNLTCSHLFKRGRQSVRYDEMNCACQCMYCNALHNADPKPYTAWAALKYGIGTIWKLEERSRQIKKWTAEELNHIIQKYK